MSHLILHIGPPKCGSSSIQHFLKKEVNGQYIHVSPPLIDVMNETEIRNNGKVKKFMDEVNALLKSNGVVILSHEYFFECHAAINYLCERLSADRITLVCYVRKSSRLLVAAFNQWEFRNPEMSDVIQES